MSIEEEPTGEQGRNPGPPPSLGEVLAHLNTGAARAHVPKALNTARKIASDERVRAMMDEYLGGTPKDKGRCVALANASFHFKKQQWLQANNDPEQQQIATYMGMGFDTIVYSLVYCEPLQDTLRELDIKEFINYLQPGVEMAEAARRRPGDETGKLGEYWVLSNLLTGASSDILKDIQARHTVPDGEFLPPLSAEENTELNAHRFGQLAAVFMISEYLDSQQQNPAAVTE